MATKTKIMAYGEEFKKFLVGIAKGIKFTPTTRLTSTNVQSAIEEVDGKVASTERDVAIISPLFGSTATIDGTDNVHKNMTLNQIFETYMNVGDNVGEAPKVLVIQTNSNSNPFNLSLGSSRASTIVLRGGFHNSTWGRCWATQTCSDGSVYEGFRNNNDTSFTWQRLVTSGDTVVLTGTINNNTYASLNHVAYPSGYNKDNCMVSSVLYEVTSDGETYWVTNNESCRPQLRTNDVAIYTSGAESLRGKRFKFTLTKIS